MAESGERALGLRGSGKRVLGWGAERGLRKGMRLEKEARNGKDQGMKEACHHSAALRCHGLWKHCGGNTPSKTQPTEPRWRLKPEAPLWTVIAQSPKFTLCLA